MSEIYTHSRLACFRQCPRKHQIRYVFALAPEAVPEYVDVGSAYHLAHYLGEEAIGRVAPFIREAARAMQRKWTPRLIAEYVALELRAETTVPATRSNGVYAFAGGIDAVARLHDGRLAVVERKTTSRLDDDYWRRVELDSQVSGYFVLARAAGLDVQTVVYDVAVRPGCRPLKATPPEEKKYRKSDGALYANQREHDETPDEYFERCLAEMTPDRYDMREVAITQQRIDEWRRDTAEEVCAIEAGFAYRNTAACSHCEYLAICHRSDLNSNTPGGYVRLADVHPELATLGASPALLAGR